MAYKYSKGEREFGDLEYENDPEGDTKIDFEDNYIALVASGSSVLTVSGSQVGIGTTRQPLNLPSTVQSLEFCLEKATLIVRRFLLMTLIIC